MREVSIIIRIIAVLDFIYMSMSQVEILMEGGIFLI